MSRTNVTSTTNILLVHGALTGPEVWSEVIARLQAAGAEVSAPVLPMRSLDEDARALAATLTRLDRPTLVVGHSYAGAVISHPLIAATGNLSGLVFVAAFQPDSGEAAGELNERFPGSRLTPENLALTPNPSGGQDLTLRPERFADVYAADLDPERAAVMAVSQHPIDPAALGQTFAEPPSWRSRPSWALVATRDRSLPPESLRFMARRAGSRTVEVDSSHAVPAAHPDAVADLILDAARQLA